MSRYKGAQYNIPVIFWIPRQYPQQCPTVLVVPTDDMVLKSSTHVDQSGRIYHPFLSYWHQRPQSTLVELNLILKQIFEQASPVYAKRKAVSVDVIPPSSASIQNLSNPSIPTQSSPPKSTGIADWKQLPNPIQPRYDDGVAKLVEQKRILMEMLRPHYQALESNLPRSIDQLLVSNNQLEQNQQRLHQSIKMFQDVKV